MDLRILACSLGSVCVSRSLSVRSCFLALMMILLSLFLYSLCLFLFSGVGFVSLSLYSLC